MASVRQLTKANREGKRPWIVEYTDREGKRRRATPTSGMKKDADALRRKIEAELDAAIHTAASTTELVRVVCDEYLRHTDDRVRDGRIGLERRKEIRQAVNKGIVPFIGKHKFTELTPVIVEDWYRDMCASGLHAYTARRRVQMLGLIEEYAIKRRYVRVGCVPVVLQELRGIQRYSAVRSFTVDEVGRLLKLAEGQRRPDTARSDMMLRVMLNVAAFCGLRYGEIVGLQVENVDYAARVIRVRKSFSKLEGLKAPKTRAGVRDFPMPLHVSTLLRMWQDQYFLENSQNLIFTSEVGTPMQSSNFHHNQWRPLLVRAGLDDDEERGRPHFHSCRHFTASFMISQGYPLTEVTALLGHKTFDTTLQVYAHPIVGGHRRHDAIDRMADALLMLPPTIDATVLRHEPLSI